jgi:hydroxymethylpyrimidine/phosphomethylpyrimidine kinase
LAGGDAERGLSAKTPSALTIAGSDSGAGAGIQADLKTFAALGVYGASALTAVTAQNTKGVQAIYALPAGIVAKQVDAVFDDFNIAAVKIGMLPSRGVVEAVAEALTRRRPPFVVLDPVLIASSGAALVDPAAVLAMKEKLFPLLDCLTPNLSEAAALLGADLARNEAEMTEQGLALLERGPRAVLVKGGHLDGLDAIDILVTRAGERRYVGRRIASRNLHGTGCTLSAAIAAYRLIGLDLEEAVAMAKDFVARAIEHGRELTLGSGPGPLIQQPLAGSSGKSAIP